MDVFVTAAGLGGCVDSVRTESLVVTEGTGGDVWASFDLRLDNNCGDPGAASKTKRSTSW